jgi:isocitrate dehydrogenase kinase/phosphatase
MQEKIIDKFNIWLYEFIKKDKDIDKILTELREKYTDYNIPNFVIPTLFSLNVANDEKNNSCFLSYKFI